MFDMGFKPLKYSQNKYLRESFFDVDDPIFDEYSLKRTPIGFVRDYDKKGNPTKYDKKKLFTVDYTEATREIFIARNRTGKSYFVRSKSDRLYKAGMSMVYLPDVKNEYCTSIRPVQSKFRNKLIKNENAQGVPIKVFRPTFFQGLQGNAAKLPEGQNWCSINLSTLLPSDMISLLKALNLTSSQIIGIERAIYESWQEGKYISDWDDMKELIENCEYIRQSSEILNKMFRIVRYNPFDSGYHIKPYEYLKDGYILALNYQYFDSLEKNNGFIEVTLTSWLRDIINARKEKLISPVFFVIDESPRFIPAKGNNTFRHEVLESVDTDSAYHINYSFLTQDIQSIPERIFSQCKYIYLPYNIKYEQMIMAFKQAGLKEAKVKAQQYNEMRRITNKMQKFDWIVIDVNNNKWQIITPLAPLSEVKETDI